MATPLLGHVGQGAVHARERPAPQRRVGDEPDAQLAGDGHDLVLDAPWSSPTPGADTPVGEGSALLQELCHRYRPAVLLVTHDVDEAILLADRVLVLADGAIAFDARVEVPTPRLRGDAAFGALRSRLLAELGVDEAAEGAHG